MFVQAVVIWKSNYFKTWLFFGIWCRFPFYEIKSQNNFLNEILSKAHLLLAPELRD